MTLTWTSIRYFLCSSYIYAQHKCTKSCRRFLLFVVSCGLVPILSISSQAPSLAIVSVKFWSMFTHQVCEIMIVLRSFTSNYANSHDATLSSIGEWIIKSPKNWWYNNNKRAYYSWNIPVNSKLHGGEQLLKMLLPKSTAYFWKATAK